MLERVQKGMVPEGNLALGDAPSWGLLIGAFREMVRRHFLLILFVTFLSLRIRKRLLTYFASNFHRASHTYH